MTKILLSLSLLFSVSIVHASEECALGDYSDSYLSQMDADGYTMFTLIERISLSANRVKSLTAFEKKAILTAAQEYAKEFADEVPTSEKEAVEQLAGQDGYIVHFSHAYTSEKFMIIASYPGDNEYGTVYKLATNPNGDEYVLVKIANIGDGDLYNCTYTMEDFNK